jgi:hypothetical protein
MEDWRRCIQGLADGHYLGDVAGLGLNVAYNIICGNASARHIMRDHCSSGIPLKIHRMRDWRRALLLGLLGWCRSSFVLVGSRSL